MLTQKKERKVIATDVDGILVKWQSGLPYFAQKYQLPIEGILDFLVDDKFVPPGEIFGCDEEFAVKLLLKYNNSDFIRYLAPYDDAVKWVNELKKEYDFVAVTALGNSVDAHLNRQFNLNALFPGAFKDIMVCDFNESKDVLLEKVKEKYGDRVVCYVDDLGSHIESAVKVFEGTDVVSYHMPRGQRTAPNLKSYDAVNDWEHLAKELNSKSVKDIMSSMEDAMLRMGIMEEARKSYVGKGDSILRAEWMNNHPKIVDHDFAQPLIGPFKCHYTFDKDRW
ncbi:hypothetical protein KNT65_gp227 [Escherichia phage EcS1]|uniref:Uncharacterized protein n=1 Tax=Escherichia phage EcS1 TaxID=2083276 RepID=A0A2Z5ZCR2_9CAUD|nr:hypothetical protein KNT65_gp227 [Escherichia phage EcS1]BBC78266.1 Hypothetical protein JD18_193 [Escherichia phage EcS1]